VLWVESLSKGWPVVDFDGKTGKCEKKMQGSHHYAPAEMTFLRGGQILGSGRWSSIAGCGSAFRMT